ncbi:Parkinson disease protein 7 homolog [Amphibalanus amphitrite]|uniref:Parkinson disease protein 7 homolog n=1 Tax=Amphibalanus amphitrite TaxID=1232801 RepID=UPI001C8FD401|nr:Parkinson disease protein 7 homolog [Amphibalanus amphitrite]
MVKKALVLVAEGTEEMEAVTIVDVLRRAEVEVTVAGVAGCEPVRCSRSVRIVPDAALSSAADAGPYDALVLPGGLGGAQAFCQSQLVKRALLEQEATGRLIAAICAAPTALRAHGLCTGRALTSYPTFRDELVAAGYRYLEQPVVVDGTLVTSRGPGTAVQFALELVGQLCGGERQARTAAALLSAA